jgi:hypothetical protein
MASAFETNDDHCNKHIRTNLPPKQTSKPITNFSKSFRPMVELPQDGSGCNLHRHYRHFLRQMVSRLDYLAGLDRSGERFVFAGNRNFIMHCKNFDSGKHPSERMVIACLKQLRAQGIYKIEKKVRQGSEHTGKTVAKHDDLTKIMDAKYCVFCDPTSPATSPPTSPQGEENFTSDFISNFTSAGNEIQASQQIGDGHESPARSLARNNSDSNSFSSSNMNEKKEFNPFISKAELNEAFPARERIVKDGISGNSLERTLDILSDGSFQTATLNYYKSCPELTVACNRVIEHFGQEPFRTRKMCHTLMQSVMDDLKKQGINAPRGWVPVLRQLLATQTEPLHIVPDGVNVFETPSALVFCRGLERHRDLLNAAAHEFGVPESWKAAVTFLIAVVNRLNNRFLAVPVELIEALEYFKGRVEDCMPASVDLTGPLNSCALPNSGPGKQTESAMVHGESKPTGRSVGPASAGQVGSF